VDGLKTLTVDGMKQRIDERYDQLVRYYGIKDGDLRKKISDFKELRKGSAQKDLDYEGTRQGASKQLADAVYADLAPTFSQDSGLAENDIHSAIDAVLTKDVAGFKSRTWEGAKTEPDISAFIESHLQGPDQRARYELHKSAFQTKLADFRSGSVESIFADEDFSKQIEDYKLTLAQIEELERKLGTTAYNKERLVDMYGRKAKARAAVLVRAEKPLRMLEGYVLDQLSASYTEARSKGDPRAASIDQDQLAKALPVEPSPTWWIDWANMLGLAAVGLCLMLGLLTRLAALGGVGLLTLYYLCMPPLPGLPDNPMAEGHYLIVNKNLIEAIALLVIASSRVGRWCGLDAFLGRRTAPGSRPARSASAW